MTSPVTYDACAKPQPRNIFDQRLCDYPEAKGKEDAICPTRSPGGTCQCLPACARCGVGPHMGRHLAEWPIHQPYDHPFVAPDPGLVAVAPVLTGLTPQTAPLGSPSFTLHVSGNGFRPGAVIEFAGNDEPTVYVSATEVTTGVDMTVWLGADPAIPVVVRQHGVTSNAVTFAFTAAR